MASFEQLSLFTCRTVISAYAQVSVLATAVTITSTNELSAYHWHQSSGNDVTGTAGNDGKQVGSVWSPSHWELWGIQWL
ncbi:hypothetical protein Pelo_19602 [Pelomyxa schiedti]|nr:hypothetical protein Pelo_19602 [Pelomyxa schiedti]